MSPADRFGIAGVRGALLDIDGTLLHGDAAIPGAARTIGALRSRGIPFRLTTNTTRRPRAAIADVLRQAGIQVDASEILLPASLAARRIVASGRPRAGLLVPEPSRCDFDGVIVDESRPDWVVVGDLGRGFTFDRLNQAFYWLRDGARLIALQKNRYWSAGDEGILLDAGPFVAALEYAAGVTAELVGKPSPAFFELALAEIGLPAGEVVSVGDSLDNDCFGAARVGCRTILLRTGVFEEDSLATSEVKPDRVLDSIAELLAD